MKDLNDLDPIPKLGSKLQTEVIFFHPEEREIKPFLYEKDGRLRYAPPVDVGLEFRALFDQYRKDLMDVLEEALCEPDAVEEEKQDNKHASVLVWWDGKKAHEMDAEGWISHIPGDPMPCDPETRVSLKCDYRTHFKCEEYKDGAIEHNAARACDVAWDGAVIAWKPA
jgi:hypothetical protein